MPTAEQPPISTSEEVSARMDRLQQCDPLTTLASLVLESDPLSDEKRNDKKAKSWFRELEKSRPDGTLQYERGAIFKTTYKYDLADFEMGLQGSCSPSEVVTTKSVADYTQFIDSWQEYEKVPLTPSFIVDAKLKMLEENELCTSGALVRRDTFLVRADTVTDARLHEFFEFISTSIATGLRDVMYGTSRPSRYDVCAPLETSTIDGIVRQAHRNLNTLKRKVKLPDGTTYVGIQFKPLTAALANAAYQYLQDHPICTHMGGLIRTLAIEATSPRTVTEMFCVGYAHRHNGEHEPLFDRAIVKLLLRNYTHVYQSSFIERSIRHQRSLFEYPAIETLQERNYLIPYNGRHVIEPPAFQKMRIALCTALGDVESGMELNDETAMETLSAARVFYLFLSCGMISPATPTQCYAGTPDRVRQLSSCFLCEAKDDSIAGIFDSMRNVAETTKKAGGVAKRFTRIRAAGSYIAGTRGQSNGVPAVLRKLVQATGDYVNDNSASNKGKNARKTVRKAAMATYIDWWHKDSPVVIDMMNPLKQVRGNPLKVHIGLSVNNEFVRRLQRDDDLYLFCPTETYDETTGKYLYDLSGDEFAERYNDLVALAEEWHSDSETQYHVTKVKATEYFMNIILASFRSGYPYIINTDAATDCNMEGMPITMSNLCTEIMEYVSREESAVCNLMTIVMSAFVKSQGNPDEVEVDRKFTFEGEEYTQTVRDPGFDYDLFALTTRVTTRMINGVMRRTRNPLPEYTLSNTNYHAVGIGEQGTASAFLLRNMSYGSPEAVKFHRTMSAVRYYAALQESSRIASIAGPYKEYPSNPAREGKLHHDLWWEKARKVDYVRDAWDEVAPGKLRESADETFSSDLEVDLDWDVLRDDIKYHGLYNGLLIALAPTATTALILGNTEGFEPMKSTYVQRKLVGGEFQVVDITAALKLMRRDMWNRDTTAAIRMHNGDPSQVESLPVHLRHMLRPAHMITQSEQLSHALAIAPFIDQSFSRNVFSNKNTSVEEYASWIFLGLRFGLKTVQYYHRSNKGSETVTVDTTEAHRRLATDAISDNWSDIGSPKPRSSDGTPTPFLDSWEMLSDDTGSPPPEGATLIDDIPDKPLPKLVQAPYDEAVEVEEEKEEEQAIPEYNPATDDGQSAFACALNAARTGADCAVCSS